MAAKAIADQARATQLLPFKGGLMNGEVVDAEQIRAISRLPSREVLYGQLVGVVASPISGLVRTLGALVGGLAVALGQVREKKESGEIPAGEPAGAAIPAPEAPEAPAEEASAEEPPTAAEPVEEPKVEAAEPEAVEEPAAEAVAEETSTADQAEPASEPAQDDNKTDASAQEPESAEATKED
jgi:large subunit ribosomal protein L10